MERGGTDTSNITRGSSSNSAKMGTTRIFVCPTTGSSVEFRVPLNESVQGLKWAIARKLNIRMDRIILLYNNKQLKNGLLLDYNIGENSCLTLVPSMESGLSFLQKRQSGVMQALESLSDAQVSDFLSGRAPLVLALRLGEHMMFIQLQLSSTPCGNRRSRPVPVTVPSPERFSVKDHQEIPSPTLITEMEGNTMPNNMHQFRHFPENEKASPPPTPDYYEGNMRSPASSGAVIESMQHLGKGIYSGTFYGSLDPALQSEDGRPRRDLSTIVHILNDLLEATPQYRQHCFIHQSQNLHTSMNASFKESNRSQMNIETDYNNAELKGKVKHLQMMMQERKLRRRARRDMRGPYQWESKTQTAASQYQPSNCNQQRDITPQVTEGTESESEVRDAYTGIEKETLAV